MSYFKTHVFITIFKIIFIYDALELFLNRYIDLVVGSVGARQMECSFGRSIGKFATLFL